MTKELGNLNPLNEEKFFEEFESLEEDARKEKIQSVLKERNDILDSNRKLFARAKEAEGFKQEDDGSWIKNEKKSKADDKPVKSDDKLLERLEGLELSSLGISEADEVELAKGNWSKYKDSGGTKEFGGFLKGDGFQSDLKDIRTAKANQKATSDIKGEQGESGVKNTPEYWIAKTTKTADGNLLFSDETPKELYSKILEKLAENEPSNSEKLKFYNSK